VVIKVANCPHTGHVREIFQVIVDCRQELLGRIKIPFADVYESDSDVALGALVLEDANFSAPYAD
jgi:hypothetical protein